MPDIIKLPTERHLQLKCIADKLGVSVTELLGQFVRQEIAKGTIPDAMPGFTITAKGNHLLFAIGAGIPTKLAGGGAVSLAKHLEDVVNGGMQMLDMDINVSVTRVGTGIKIDLLEGGSRVVSKDVARDIAGIIRRTVSAKLRAQVAEHASGQTL